MLKRHTLDDPDTRRAASDFPAARGGKYSWGFATATACGNPSENIQFRSGAVEDDLNQTPLLNAYKFNLIVSSGNGDRHGQHKHRSTCNLSELWRSDASLAHSAANRQTARNENLRVPTVPACDHVRASPSISRTGRATESVAYSPSIELRASLGSVRPRLTEASRCISVLPCLSG